MTVNVVKYLFVAGHCRLWGYRSSDRNLTGNRKDGGWSLSVYFLSVFINLFINLILSLFFSLLVQGSYFRGPV